MDHLHLAGAITPGIVAAKRLCDRDIVVGKSMALRRRDLEAMGGFEAVQDVLAEDYVMGRMVSTVLGKRVAVAHRPIQNVSERRTLSEFAARYRRWGVLQRQAAGPIPYVALALLNPVLLASLATAVSPSPGALSGLAVTCAAKAALDGVAARALRPGGFRLRQLAVVPLKDLVFGAAWAWGLFRRDVAWRGTRLVVGRGTRIEAPVRGEPASRSHRAPPRDAMDAVLHPSPDTGPGTDRAPDDELHRRGVPRRRRARPPGPARPAGREALLRSPRARGGRARLGRPRRSGCSPAGGSSSSSRETSGTSCTRASR